MQNDPYSSCPCGSGKKFKWCCQPIHAQIAKAFTLDEEGQHEAALRAMEEVIAQHPTNPEVWGRKAQLLFQNDKAEEAEKTLERAFELFPDYPFGYFLKARFRLYEGEVAGALALLRKSAELYDPNAVDILAQLQIDIFDCEMKLNHPVAAHAAAELAARFNPASDSIRQGLMTIFSAQNPNLPACATHAYTFKPLPDSAMPEARAAWEGALQSSSTGRLGDATKAFEQLTQGDSVEPAAWFNLGLCHAWSGNNAPALAALDNYVAQESDETQAAQAWALAEVLRFGSGVEEQADIVEHTYGFALRDPRMIVGVLADYEKAGLLSGAQVDEKQGVLTAAILELPGPALTPELAAQQSLRCAAYVMIVGNFVRLWNTDREALERVIETMKQKLGAEITQPQSVRGPAKFFEVFSEAIVFPRNVTTKEEALARIRGGFEKFFEEIWIHRPLKSLNGIPPIDAAGHKTLRKKLLGLVQFICDCAAMTEHPYDFDRLRRKLGLLDGAAPAAEPGGALDIPALSAAELAALAA